MDFLHGKGLPHPILDWSAISESIYADLALESICEEPNEYGNLFMDPTFITLVLVGCFFNFMSNVYAAEASNLSFEVAKKWYLEYLVIRTSSMLRSVNAILANLMIYKASEYVRCHLVLYMTLFIMIFVSYLFTSYIMPYRLQLSEEKKKSSPTELRVMPPYVHVDEVEQMPSPRASQNMMDDTGEFVYEYEAETFYLNIAKTIPEILFIFFAHSFCLFIWALELMHHNLAKLHDDGHGDASPFNSFYFLIAIVLLPLMEPLLQGEFPDKQDQYSSVRRFMRSTKNQGKTFHVFAKSVRSGIIVGGGFEAGEMQVNFREWLCFVVNQVFFGFQFCTLPLLMATSPDLQTLIVGIGGSACVAGLTGCEKQKVQILAGIKSRSPEEISSRKLEKEPVSAESQTLIETGSGTMQFQVRDGESTRTRD